MLRPLGVMRRFEALLKAMVEENNEAMRKEMAKFSQLFREAKARTAKALLDRHLPLAETLEEFEHLARIVGIPEDRIGEATFDEIYNKSIAWADQQRIKKLLEIDAQNAATNPANGAAAVQELFEDIAAAAACVVGGRRCAGLSRLIAVAKLKKTVEERLRLAEQTGLLLRPDVSARELARLLNCTPAAVKKTRWWRNRMAQRRRAKADAEAPYHRKHGPRRPKWQRRGRGPHLEKPTQG